MAKEKNMTNPNCLGHYHRDIIKIVDTKQYYVKILMSCNHTTWMSKASYKKYKNDAHLCITCNDNETPKFPEILETHQIGIISIENKELFSGTTKGDLGIQISKDGKVWICINGIAFIRFRPTGE